jgi:hypothetical protein
LKSTNVIAKALDKLPKSVEINESEQMPSLIRAAASIYASDKLLGNKNIHFKAEWEKFITEKEITPSEKLKKVALIAEEYKTNLWF